MQPNFAAALRAAALAATLWAGAAVAHEGHDHGPAPAPTTNITAPRGESDSDVFELVAVVREGGLTVYVDRFTTNEPVNGASVSVETADGPVELTAGPEGTYTVSAPWLAKPGRHELLFTVMTPDGTAEILPVSLTVPAPAAAATVAPAPTFEIRERLARQDPVLIAVAAGSFLLGLILPMALRRRRRPKPEPALAFAIAVSAVLLPAATALAHEGHQHSEPPQGSTPPGANGDLAQRLPDGTVFVPKPTQRILAIRTVMSEAGTYRRAVELPGRIIPDPNASGVVQSTVGGRLSAPKTGFPRLGTRVKKGDVLAYVTPPVQRIDVSDMRQRQGELDQQIAIVQRRVNRFQKLAPSGAVSQVQLEEAVEELRGLRDRRAALDAIRSEPEPLLAPVDGVIAEAAAVAGQMAAPGAMIFQIVDPSSLWVEALSFEALPGAQRASALLADGRALDLVYQGSGFADRNQSVPVQFAIQGDTSGLRVGQFVTVQALTDGETQGLAIPRTSLVRSSNGQDVVFEHVTAERFAPRAVRVAPLDGERVIVQAGIEPKRRIVTQGAELLDQVR